MKWITRSGAKTDRVACPWLIRKFIDSEAEFLFGPSGMPVVEDAADIATGYGLVNGKRSVYIVVTKRADASTLSVVQAVKDNIPKMQSVLSEGIRVRFEFDQSPYVKRAIWGVVVESLLGAAFTGLMVVLFLRDWRSVVVVVLNIPFALLGGVVALWLTGQTINLMTLGGLALAVGILVDESTVEVENIHAQMERTSSIAWAVRLGNAETAVPRLLAMLCVLAVFVPSFFMEGAARALFMPLSLAVGFSMVTSYLLSSTFVPVMCTWLLRHHDSAAHAEGRFSFVKFRAVYARFVGWMVRLRWVLLPSYIGVTALLVLWILGGHPGIGTEIFPSVDSGQFQLRLRAPDGTSLNIQSFMGSIMAIGVAVANAILLVTFAERTRREGATAREAAVDGAQHRLRPILMTSCAMMAGMLPMALGFGEGGEQTAPLGRAVIGGLAMATVATLVVLPAVFAVVQSWSSARSASLDPEDPESPQFAPRPGASPSPAISGGAP